MINHTFDTKQFKITPKRSFSLKDHQPDFCDGFSNKKEARKQLKYDIKKMSELQYNLFAENRQALLIIFQAMDAAGKDGAIKHVFSGVNPQGCEVHSFKQPSAEELKHDYLWRHYQKLPEHGKIGIFNRSHYENVLITKVHPEFLMAENLPGIHTVEDIQEDFWEERYQQINNFEQTLVANGTTIIKFFLHLSKDEQKKRFLDRIRKRDKNWKFSSSDIEERQYWKKYQKVYEEALSKTSTNYAPWYVIPADNKWFTHVAIGNIIVETLIKMDIQMPTISKQNLTSLKEAKRELLQE
ncbi:polyphosphate kinase 2 family protein [Sunxiuqinia sp. A32]|uniref:polyphosphate kinase 2 family protein n=1 Tax=Sunxiuqinia sp. A32 TaxID=3461496 RepID=UPI0040463A35